MQAYALTVRRLQPSSKMIPRSFPDKFERTPLMRAAMWGRTKTVQVPLVSQ